MACYKCKKNAELNLVSIGYCKRCFAEIIEKRVRKTIRLSKVKGSMVAKGPITYHFLSMVFSESKKGIIKVSSTKKSNAPIFIPWFADDEIAEFLGLKNSPGSGSIKLFYNITYKEMEGYCRIKKIRFSGKKSIIDGLEKNHPGLKHAFVKSIVEVKNAKM